MQEPIMPEPAPSASENPTDTQQSTQAPSFAALTGLSEDQQVAALRAFFKTREGRAVAGGLLFGLILLNYEQFNRTVEQSTAKMQQDLARLRGENE